MDSARNVCAKLVIIDDETAHLRLLQDALACDSLEIFTSPNSDEGLELVRAKRPHIVLLDLYMPERNGMEMLGKIVELDAGIDVIMMTGNYSAESAVEAIQKGATDYMPKPVSISKLRHRMGQLIAELHAHQRSYDLD